MPSNVKRQTSNVKKSVRVFALLSTVIFMYGLAGLLTLPTQAATFTVSPTAVNRLIQGGFANATFSDLFSTNSSDTQTTLVKTENSAFNTALTTNLGALGIGESYQINSAILVVGNSFSLYITSGNKESHLVLLSYNESNITWNSFNSLGGVGTAYASANLVTGVQAANSVSWNFTTTVRAFLAGTISNYGIYFSGTGTGAAEELNTSNVVWQLDAVKIPATSAVSAPIFDLKSAQIFVTEVEK